MCCGGKRQSFHTPERGGTWRVTQPPPPPGPRRAFKPSFVYFEYTGRTGMTVLGGATGQRYRFAAAGARVAVDRRDAGSLSAVPGLRMTNLGR